MSRKSSFITVIGAALMLVLPATGLAKGERFVEAPQWQQALQARSEGLNKKYGLGEYASSVSERFVQSPQWYQAELARSEGLNKQHGLGQYAGSNVDMINARERSFEAKSQVEQSSVVDAREEAFAAKREVQLTASSGPDAFERTVVASTREQPPIVGDDRFRLDPTTGGEPAPVQTTNTREIEWPQVGVGLGIGIMLMIGLYLALKGTRPRPLAH